MLPAVFHAKLVASVINPDVAGLAEKSLTALFSSLLIFTIPLCQIRERIFTNKTFK